MAIGPDDYPGRTPRRYVLAQRVPEKDRVIMYDPAAFYFGHFRRFTKKQRQAALRTWQEYWVQTKLFSRLFDVPFEQRTYTRERTGNGYYKRDTIDLLHVRHSDVEHAIVSEIRARQSLKFKAAHLWNGDGDRELFKTGELHVSSQNSYTGSIVTTAKVRADSSARNSDVPKYRHVSIDDLFGQSDHFITDANSSSEDFTWARTKEGRTNVIVIDKHLASVMDLAKKNPHAFREYEPAKGTAFLPFDFEASYTHEGVRFTEPEYFPGMKPPREVLIIDILLYWLFKENKTKESKTEEFKKAEVYGATQFEISKNLMKMHFLMDPSVVSAIRNGRLHFEMLTQGPAIPDLPLEKIRALRKLHTEIDKNLTSRGYCLDGFTLEFVGTPWEAVAWNYVSTTGSARVLYHEWYAYPPLVVYRTHNTPQGKLLEGQQHPIALLTKRGVAIDDWTRRNRTTEVAVPPAYIDDVLCFDYKQTIAEYFDGGIAAFQNQVTRRYMYGSSEEKAMGRKLFALVR